MTARPTIGGPSASPAATGWARDVFYQAPLYPYFLALIYRIFDDSAATVRDRTGVPGRRLLRVALLRRAGDCSAGAACSPARLLAIYPPAIFLDGTLDKTASPQRCCARCSRCGRPGAGWRPALALGPARPHARERAAAAIPILIAAPPRGRLRFAAAVLFVLVPVGVRNLAAGGEFHVTTAQSGPNFYIGNHAGARLVRAARHRTRQRRRRAGRRHTPGGRIARPQPDSRRGLALLDRSRARIHPLASHGLAGAQRAQDRPHVQQRRDRRHREPGRLRRLVVAAARASRVRR